MKCNQERGWNDPPQFSYGLQTARTPQKNLLNKRPTLPGCAPAWKATPPEGAAGRIGGVEDPGQSEAEPNLEDVVEVLERVLARCRVDVAPQVCNDMEKRLRLFEDSWTSGRLSLPVRRRMSALSQELQAGHWDQADEIHRSLMVDYVTEVSQWMVGVKRLIAESRGPKP
ncbi:steroid receptor RNA activator 1 isoform X4 [Syngnathus typhle]|uniref:steroid receptor RNA activator 1 isoform X4 n=1 Tax=Syngnathus typhle TaxID=161592 RepID=UPI002A6AB9A4|nr:steroid receptor RNA activator 1 isoform X4 [Syngnathus typhle]